MHVIKRLTVHYIQCLNFPDRFFHIRPHSASRDLQSYGVMRSRVAVPYGAYFLLFWFWFNVVGCNYIQFVSMSKLIDGQGSRLAVMIVCKMTHTVSSVTLNSALLLLLLLMFYIC